MCVIDGTCDWAYMFIGGHGTCCHRNLLSLPLLPLSAPFFLLISLLPPPPPFLSCPRSPAPGFPPPLPLCCAPPSPSYPRCGPLPARSTWRSRRGPTLAVLGTRAAPRRTSPAPPVVGAVTTAGVVYLSRTLPAWRTSCNSLLRSARCGTMWCCVV